MNATQDQNKVSSRCRDIIPLSLQLVYKFDGLCVLLNKFLFLLSPPTILNGFL